MEDDLTKAGPKQEKFELPTGVRETETLEEALEHIQGTGAIWDSG